MHYRLVSAALLLAMMCACSAERIVPPTFDAQRSFGYLEDQVQFGPRVPGSEAWAKARDYYYAHFSRLGLAVDSQSFGFRDPYSQTTKPLVNVFARARGLSSEEPPLLFVAHYDSRPRTDRAVDPARRLDSLPGANDGASGVAVLMELANLFASKPPAGDVVLMLADGEDWGEEGDTDYYLLGTQFFARQGIHGKYRFGIVIDLIGDKDLQIYREAYSEQFNKPLNDMVWDAAKRLNAPAFTDSVKWTVLDDHLPINAGGVPAIVLIDFDYAHWHTEHDLPENCSAESLAQVGRVLAEIAYNKSLWPKN